MGSDGVAGITGQDPEELGLHNGSRESMSGAWGALWDASWCPMPGDNWKFCEYARQTKVNSCSDSSGMKVWVTQTCG